MGTQQACSSIKIKLSAKLWVIRMTYESTMNYCTIISWSYEKETVWVKIRPKPREDYESQQAEI